MLGVGTGVGVNRIGGANTGGGSPAVYISTAYELDQFLESNGIAPFNKEAIGIELGYASEYLFEQAIYTGNTITEADVLAAWAAIAP